MEHAIVLGAHTSFCANCHAYVRLARITDCYRCGTQFESTVILVGGSLTLAQGAEASSRRAPGLQFLGLAQKQTSGSSRYRLVE